MIDNQLNIEVHDSLFDPDLPKTPATKVHARKIKRASADPSKPGLEETYYNVWLYLDGGDLPYIESVTYTLHESFENPTQTVARTPSNPRCKLDIWTWGLFPVNVTLLDKKGFTYIVSHELTFDKELPSDPNRYVYEEDEPNVRARPILVT